MTAFVDFTMPDGAATPVTRTFKKLSRGDGNDSNSSLAVWEDRLSGIKVGFNTVSQLVRFPNKNVRSTKVSVRITAPILENVSNSTVSGIAPAPTVSYKPLATIEVVLPERSTPASRADLLAYITGFVARTEFREAILNLDPVN